MPKLLIFTLLTLLTGTCKNNTLPSNHLKGNVEMITEYKINIEHDSLNRPARDTLSIIKKSYNNQNKIVHRSQTYTFSNDTTDITFSYDANGRLEQELVKLSFNTNAIEVNYIYRDSLLDRSISKSMRDSVSYTQIQLYKYNNDKELTQTLTSQLFVNLRTRDTITNSLQIDIYDKNELIIASKYQFHENPSKNFSYKYRYRKENLIKTLKYNQQDSLVSTINFDYKKDSLKNWIERQAFQNNRLIAITTRKIEYR